MHVAVDAHNLLTDRRGIGVYLRAVLSRMLRDGGCELTLLVRRSLPILQKRALAAELGSEDFALSSRVPSDADIAWHPWNGTFFRGARRNAVTMHDAAPFAFPAAGERKRRSQQGPFEVSAATADRIIADSHFTKDEIEKYLRVAGERIAVVPLAVDEVFSPGTPQALPPELRDRPYVLYVGAIEERKNVAPLIAAWRSSLAGRGIALAIVSADEVPSDVTALRDVTPAVCRDLYRGALAFAFPTLYEGFGLPALEALSCGTPAVVSRAASLPEVCGDAAYYVDEPKSAQAWSVALEQVVSSDELRRELSLRGPQQARKFSWDVTAHETLRLLSETAAA